MPQHLVGPGVLERHRVLGLLVTTLVVLGVGILAGELTGRLLVHLIEMVLGQAAGSGR
jgi:hypothetical protein